MEKKKYFASISKWNADRVVSISAIIVSLGTLFMIFYQTNLIRKEQKASVMPSLRIGYSISQDSIGVKENLFVINQGLGPAFIDEVRIVENGNSYDLDPYSYISRVPGYQKEETTYFNRLYTGSIISQNDRVKIFEKITDTTSRVALSRLFKFPYEVGSREVSERATSVIEIVYKNIYDDKWLIRSNEAVPQIVD
ncbi:hypothetical protein [Luteirhabdus pelagi]|uniref:hypothetical protein n=1 Tax=Luteirhabdus pelagi TaxID=2792783 RepID=UPI00193AA36E|nr:hypothetical protein [Luteirhabdus pelagi]